MCNAIIYIFVECSEDDEEDEEDKMARNEEVSVEPIWLISCLYLDYTSSPF